MSNADINFDESAYWLEPDFVLADIVGSMVNMMELPIGITLFLKGIVLTGTLVSEREYLEALSEMFTNLAKQSFRPAGAKEAQELEQAFSFKEMNESPTVDEEDDEEEQEFPSSVRHLHLKDAFILTPHPSISFGQSGFPITRIRLNAIDGWMLGQAMPLDDMELDMDDDTPDEINRPPRRLH